MKSVFFCAAVLAAGASVCRAQYGADLGAKEGGLVPLLGGEAAAERANSGLPSLWGLNNEFVGRWKDAKGAAKSPEAAAAVAGLAHAYDDSFLPSLRELAMSMGDLRVVMAGLQVTVMTHRAFIPELDPSGGASIPKGDAVRSVVERSVGMFAGYRENRARALARARSASARLEGVRKAAEAAAQTAAGMSGWWSRRAGKRLGKAAKALSDAAALARSSAQAWEGQASAGSLHDAALLTVERCNGELAAKGTVTLACHEASVSALNKALDPFIREEYRVGEHTNKFHALEKLSP